METEQPAMISARRQRSISSRRLPQCLETEMKTLNTSRHRARKKSFDTSDIMLKLPSIQTRYLHKDIWIDSNGNVFRGIKPNKEDIQQSEDEEDKKEEIVENGKTDTLIKINDDGTNKKKKKKRIKKIVFLEIKIKRISAIDTTSETFRCRFHYYLTWLSSFNEYNLFELDRDHYSPEWIPKIEWTNAAEVHEHFQGSNFTIKSSKSVGFNEEWRINANYLGFNGKAGKWNRVRYEADVTFAEELELEAFPFDCQDLSLYMKVEKDNIDSCDIVPFPREGDFCLLDPQFSVLSEWYLENLVTEFGYTDPLKSKSLRCYSLVSVHIKASRKWEAHVGIIIVTFCMFSLGLGTFSQSVDPDSLGERLGFCVTFLLADVATLQLMFVHLPNIPYWTILDFYIYTSFIFLFTITIWSCLAGANQILEDIDHYLFWVFLGIYIFIHIVYIARSIYLRRRERSKLTMIASQLMEYFDGEKSITDRRAISNTWDQQILSNQEHDFYFQGAKLEPLKTTTEIFHE